MVTMNDIVFLLSSLVFFIIIVRQFYNVMSAGRVYDIRMSFVMLAVMFISIGLSLMVTLIDPEVLIYSTVFWFEQGLFILSFIFFFAELMFFFANDGITGVRK